MGDESGRLLSEGGLLRVRLVRLFDKLLETKSAKVYPTVVDCLRLWTTSATLGTESTVTEVADSVSTTASGNAVRPDQLPPDMFMLGQGLRNIPRGSYELFDGTDRSDSLHTNPERRDAWLAASSSVN